MPALWTAPRTWTTGDLVAAGDLNTHLRDNQEWLKTPPFVEKKQVNIPASYTTTSTTLVDIDATNLSLTLATTGGNVLVGFIGYVSASPATPAVILQLVVNGTAVTGDYFTARAANAPDTALNFTYLHTGLAAGTHTFKMQWRVSAAGTASLFRNNTIVQFWAREV
jgi:hypothetical protein